ncbi:hypothetical protein [Pseudomonas aeruginosa]|jgi:hypothetical protein|uniref:hypothetical protein n=1 Tax=Pseudomonas aeruginosa TaxID=287 RepID=UPI00287D1AD7|nr:hypothetical protein [Pseudomonas aeruginosa]MDS9628928.1 hypothetical protein [Pseudomonas aeruginosa]
MAFLTPLERIFSKNPMRSWDDLPSGLGDLFHDLNGNEIRRGDVGRPSLELLPRVLTNSKVVVGDLIPATSWGASLANMLTRASWDALRKPLIARHNNICELCGGRFNTLDVHEVWSYNRPTAEQMKSAEASGGSFFGTQRLDGLMAICSECHRCFHLGREKVNGTLEKTLARLALLNNWSQVDIERYYNVVGDRWKENSEFLWELDLANICHPDGGITIKKDWKQHSDDPRVFIAETKWNDQSVTVLLNVKWRYSGEKDFRPAFSAD